MQRHGLVPVTTKASDVCLEMLKSSVPSEVVALRFTPKTSNVYPSAVLVSSYTSLKICV